MGREEEGVGEKEESLSLYMGSRNCAPPHLPGKLAYSPSTVIDGAVGLPTPVLMRIRDKGTRSLLRQDVPRKPPRNMCSSWLGKMVRIMTGPWRDVTL